MIVSGAHFGRLCVLSSGRTSTCPTAQSDRAFSDDYESEDPASLPTTEAKTLSHLWKSQLFRSGHPSPVCDGSSGRQTHAGGEATFEVAQEDDNQRRGRKTLAENVPEVQGIHARPQETLRLWLRISRHGRPIEQRKHREMF